MASWGAALCLACLVVQSRAESEFIELDFGRATLASNNLGKHGPNTDEDPWILYRNVAPDIDAKVTSVGGYKPLVPKRNGQSQNHEFGQVDVPAGQAVHLHFELLHRVPMSPRSFYFTVYAIDKAHGKFQEALNASKFDVHYLSNDTELDVKSMNGVFTFRGKTDADASDFPGRHVNLSKRHESRAVTLLFTNTTEFDIAYSVAVPANSSFEGSHSLLFGGASSLAFRYPPICHGGKTLYHSGKWDFEKATMLSNNLGGQGPNSKDSNNLRFSGVGSVNGRAVDLVVRTLGNYIASSSLHNGVDGHYGQINVRNNASVFLEFEIVDRSTNIMLENLDWWLLVAGLDEYVDGTAAQTATINIADRGSLQRYHVTNNTELNVSNQSGWAVFQATTPGKFADLVAHPRELTAAQKKRSIGLSFKGKAKFQMALSVAGGADLAGRNFRFAIVSRGGDLFDADEPAEDCKREDASKSQHSGAHRGAKRGDGQHTSFLRRP